MTSATPPPELRPCCWGRGDQRRRCSLAATLIRHDYAAALAHYGVGFANQDSVELKLGIDEQKQGTADITDANSKLKVALGALNG